ncbi:hypothetical protein RND81_09G003300 [Saponaria officinalis]|uniref:non-specific serine/threonine protein kinase n=1 Tax=Saponaria officinalis TaxID=3572 RepID=A0AAW1IGM5_SAPOF
MIKSLYFSKCNIILFKLILLLQFKLCSSLSANHFGDCITKTCGDVNISYPFYIIDQQNSYCGNPGFGVICKDEKFPYINISNISYVIKNVSYEDQTLQVINSMLLEAFDDKISCFGVLQGLNSTLNNEKFKYRAKHSEIFLVLNCPPKIVEQNSPNWVVCGGVGVYKNESRLRDLEGKCKGVVSVPYDDGERANIGNVKEMLEDGFSLNWLANNCSTCRVSGGQCGYDQYLNEFSCFCPDRTHAYGCVLPSKKPYSPLVLILKVSFIIVATVAFTSLVIWAKRRNTFASKVTFPWTRRAVGNQNVEAFLKIYGSLASKRFTYPEIKVMTSSFKHKLGEGGYGTVYKGKLLDGRFVAVKKLKNLKGDGKEFINEVVSISRTNHVNVVALLGFCSHRNKRALVYEFMPNGSLEKFICHPGNVQSLPRETLINIAVGVAKGLDYLHRGCNARILHFDIKPHNILLDQEFCPKISDFGLAKLSETKNSFTSMLEARGTIGYIAPEVFCKNFGGVSHKSDVYSYGMMVLDMACGRKNVLIQAQNSSEQYFPDWIYDQLQHEDVVVTNEITNYGERGLLRKLILVGLWCIQTYPSNRPSMIRVVEMLEGDPSRYKCLPSLSFVLRRDQKLSVPIHW